MLVGIAVATALIEYDKVITKKREEWEARITEQTALGTRLDTQKKQRGKKT